MLLESRLLSEFYSSDNEDMYSVELYPYGEDDQSPILLKGELWERTVVVTQATRWVS